MRVGRRFARLPGKQPVIAILAVGLLQIAVLPGPVAQEKGALRPRAAKPAAPTPAPKPAAVIPATYEVAKGDTLFRIAGKTRHPGVTLNQMVLALYRANPDAFLDGNINQLLVGRTLNVPTREAAAAVDPAEAIREVRALVARPLAPVPPPQPSAPPPLKEPSSPPPKPVPATPPKPVAKPPAMLTPQQAAERFQEGLKLEKGGDLRAALQAYIAAGEAGHGMAQKRLGDIYNTGNSVVARDYETALRWYQKARAQGVEIPKPFIKPGMKY